MRVTGNCDHSILAASRARPATKELASNGSQKAEQPTGGGRALIPLTPTQHSARPHAAIRQPASFLAHLIATRQALPQTRERRRIEPGVAVAIYSAASAMREPAPDRYRSAFSRAM
jgi:hypothetical protein